MMRRHLLALIAAGAAVVRVPSTGAASTVGKAAETVGLADAVLSLIAGIVSLLFFTGRG